MWDTLPLHQAPALLPWEPQGLLAYSRPLWTVLPATQATKVPSLSAFRFVFPVVPPCARASTIPARSSGLWDSDILSFCFKVPALSKGVVSSHSPDQHGGDCESPGGSWALWGHVSVSASQTKGGGFLVTQYGDGVDGGRGHSLLTQSPAGRREVELRSEASAWQVLGQRPPAPSVSHQVSQAPTC